MRKLWKCRKALSPVVAAIILIAVTVAVSIAVAAWMGALTFTFMKAEQLEVVGYTWDATPPTTYIDLSIRNTGTADISLSAIRVNGVTTGVTHNATNVLWKPGDTKLIEVTYNYVSGTTYEFAFLTTAGKQFAYIQRAP